MTAASVKQLTELSTIYQRLSTGRRINSAADDAAGFAISEKLGALANGLDKATDNARDMQNLLRTAEGGLNTINDSLLRIRELGVQASNGIYNDSDRALIQMEVDQMLDHIRTAARDTEFNTMKLLDGSFANKNVASNPSGTGMTISIEDTSLATLGVQGFNVTGSFDLSVIDAALEKVNDARSKIGAQQNALEYTINANETAYVNQMQALSRIADADIGKESMRLSTANVLNEARVYMQKEQMNRAGSMLNLLG